MNTTAITNLMDLNDDCLLTILDYFDLFELVKIRGVCHRLDILIDSYRYKYLTFESKIRKLNFLYDVLKFLGPTVQNLTIDYSRGEVNSNSSIIIEWIAALCENLETLSLIYVDINKPDEFSSILKQLKSLTLKCPLIENSLAECFIGAKKLEELKIFENDLISEKFFENIFNLKSLSIVDCKNVTTYDTIFKNNFSIEKLEINLSFEQDSSSVNSIVNQLRGIQELFVIVRGPVNINRFAELPKLQKLKIEINQRFVGQNEVDINELLEKLSKKNKIEELSLINFQTINCEKLAKLTNLKKLKVDVWWFNHNVELLRNLKNLEYLSLGKKLIPADILLSIIKEMKNLKYFRIQSGNVRKLEMQRNEDKTWSLSCNDMKGPQNFEELAVLGHQVESDQNLIDFVDSL
ncbi:uncharacterized protein LOC134830122 isoform X2 [Culicoides brevitarsis]|uniref:uncharacterized protein LOC134830122 isoform X2 n=1 Tax=Culicoides brevitarsis TaxID=469753 RepID=UPI00307C5423